MDEFFKAAAALKADLQRVPTPESTLEGQSIDLLGGVLEAAARRKLKALDNRMALLKQFWLESVAWCSELSKKIERLLILYEDAREKRRN